MASVCVNNSLPLSPLPSPPPPDLTTSSSPDFEFCIHDQPPVPMLPADQLFSQGFLLPSNPPPPSDPSPSPLFSPKAPRCSTRWRDLLRLKKLPSPSPTPTQTTPSRSFKHFLHRSSKSAGATLTSSSDSFPLLNHSDSLDFSIPASSRLSLSSSSCSSQAHDLDDLPRLSLDLDKTRPPRIRSLRPRSDGLLPYLDNNRNCTINGRGRNSSNPMDASSRMGRSPIRKSTASVAGATADGANSRGVSVDSPRMNSSGRVVFQSLERSSSSPSSFNNGGGGGSQRMKKQRGVERSYSAGVRIAPVLNVPPICTLRSSTGGGSKSGGGSSSGVFGGLGQLFISSPQKKENGNGVSNVGVGRRGGQRSNNNGKNSSSRG